MAQQLQQDMNGGGYDLSIFENPDFSYHKPAPFLYFFDRNTKRGRTFPFDMKYVHFCPIEKRGKNFSNIVRLQAINPETKCLEPLMIQTPLMPTNFGLCTMNKDEDMKSSGSSGANSFGGNWKVDLSFKDVMQLTYNRDAAPKEIKDTESFFLTLCLLDQLVLQKAKENVKTWFAGNRNICLDPDSVKTVYRPLTALRYSKNKGRYYSPALRVKAGRTRGAFNFHVFDNGCKEVPPETIQPDSLLLCVLEVTGIWFVGDTSFGVGLRLLQAQVQKSELIDCFCIAQPATTNVCGDDDGDEDETVRIAPVGAPQQRVKLTGMK